MKKNRHPVLILFLTVLIGLAASLPQAATAAGPGSAAAYTAKAILPDNQIEDRSYFQLLMQPGKTQIIEVEVENYDAIPATLDIAIHNAHTNQNGLIAYRPDVSPEDPSSPRVSELATLRLDLLKDAPGILALSDGQITLDAGGRVRIPVEIHMPEDPLAGQALGGIVITRTDNTPETADAFAVQSLYSYAIALSLQTSLMPETEAPFPVLQEVERTAVAGLDALAVSIANVSPWTISGARLRLFILSDTSQTPILDVTQERVSMAPSSAMPYTVILPENASLLPGVYTVCVEWTYQENTYVLQTPLTIG